MEAFDEIEIHERSNKKLTIKIAPEMLKFTGNSKEKILETGNYTVTLGTSSIEGI